MHNLSVNRQIKVGRSIGNVFNGINRQSETHGRWTHSQLLESSATRREDLVGIGKARFQRATATGTSTRWFSFR